MTRRNVFMLALLAAILVALAAFYLYLTGSSDTGEDTQKKTDRSNGVVHIKSIYVADGENLRRPTGLGVTESGDFYITLKDTARIVGFDRNGDFKIKWGERGTEQGQMLAPLGVAADSAAGQVYVADRARFRIICYDINGKFLWERSTLNPVGIALRQDDLLISTYGPIVRMSREGEAIAEHGTRGYAPGEFDYARSILPLNDTEVIVADTNNARVQRLTISDDETAPVGWIAGTPPTRQDDPGTLFGVPSGVTRDDEGNIYVLDGFRHTITVLDPKTGKVKHTFEGLDGQGEGSFQLPTGIGYLGGDDFVVTDTYNDRVSLVRLLLPEENTVIKRYRWLALLPLLLILPLLLLFRQKRTFVTGEALDKAAEQGRVRLLAGAFKKLHVLPEVAERYSGFTEGDVEISPFLTKVGSGVSAEDRDATLAEVAKPTLIQRLLLRRHIIVCADADQCGRMRSTTSVSVRDWDSVLAEYRLEGDE